MREVYAGRYVERRTCIHAKLKVLLSFQGLGKISDVHAHQYTATD